MKIKVNIIDPTSTEFNRGSFCYVPYLCHNALNENEEYAVTLIEGFVAEEMDALPQADINLVCLWSYPQIEAAVMLAQLLPIATERDNVYFIGYTALITHLGLPHAKEVFGFDFMQDEAFLLTAMKTYPTNYYKFKNLLLSDCDMHLKALDNNEKVYPLFTSYGCPNGCSFCPSTVNCNRGRFALAIDTVCGMLDSCIARGIKNIHFTDEDFFYDIHRTAEILTFLQGKGMHLIALGSAAAVSEFIEIYGVLIIKDAGLEIIEIGFESAAEDISGYMGKGKSLSDCEKLAKVQSTFPFTIFWLVQTFYIGETISTLNETGRFMEEYGMDMDKVMGRLRTNGTTGGLGQFFQPYHGTPIFKAASKKGEFLTARPVRLFPSFVPFSFIDSVIKEIHWARFEKALPWIKLYRLENSIPSIKEGTRIEHYIPEDAPVFVKTRILLLFAILSRNGVIS